MRIDSIASTRSCSRYFRHTAWFFCAMAGFLSAADPTTGDPATTHMIPELETYAIRGMTSVHGHSVEGYETPISRLRFQPFVEIQNRGFAEAQGDISVRGGSFESSGFRIGSLPLIDPQTGHYASEIPIPARMLEKPVILTGSSNLQAGTPASVATVAYDWKPVAQSGGTLSTGFGEHGLNTQSLYLSAIPGSNESGWYADLGLARSEGNGSRPDGDHHFQQAAMRVGWHNERSDWNLAAGYQDKFFGWRGMYAPYGTAETEDIQTVLLMTDWETETVGGDRLTLAAAFRKNIDDYEFDRYRPGLYNPYEHETRLFATHAGWEHPLRDGLKTLWTIDTRFDAIQSTSLTGSFQSRSFFQSLVGIEYSGFEVRSWDLKTTALLRFSDSNRHTPRWLPSLRVELTPPDAPYGLYFDYTHNAQLPGYTAIGSPINGLFGGNPNLGWEHSHQFEWGWTRQSTNWSMGTSFFIRQDRDMTDWTFSWARPNARSASPVDIETCGIEYQASVRHAGMIFHFSYAWMTKNATYTDPLVDASFYALNYPSHRTTLSTRIPIGAHLECRMDNSFRVQESNPLRNGTDSAFLSYLSIVVFPLQSKYWEISFSVDNLWDSNFESIPAVPASGRQFAIQSLINW